MVWEKWLPPAPVPESKPTFPKEPSTATFALAIEVEGLKITSLVDTPGELVKFGIYHWEDGLSTPSSNEAPTPVDDWVSLSPETTMLPDLALTSTTTF